MTSAKTAGLENPDRLQVARSIVVHGKGIPCGQGPSCFSYLVNDFVPELKGQEFYAIFGIFVQVDCRLATEYKTLRL